MTSSGVAAGGFGPAVPSSPAPPGSPVVWDQRRYIHFHSEAFGNPTDHHDFDVFAGDQPPTVVGGYAQWATVQRPLRRALTVFQGYDPFSLQFTVRFIKFDKGGTWLTDNNAGDAVEVDIKTLEAMAGQGLNAGPPPLVYLSTYDNHGNSTSLIPFQYQAATKSTPADLGTDLVFPWVITALDWDTSPIRNPDGWRIHQMATVTVQMYVSLTPTNGQPRSKGYTVVSKNGADTALEIARAQATNDAPKLAQAIRTDPKNARLHIRSVNQTIKHGKKVWVPSSING